MKKFSWIMVLVLLAVLAGASTMHPTLCYDTAGRHSAPRGTRASSASVRREKKFLCFIIISSASSNTPRGQPPADCVIRYFL